MIVYPNNNKVLVFSFIIFVAKLSNKRFIEKIFYDSIALRGDTFMAKRT